MKPHASTEEIRLTLSQKIAARSDFARACASAFYDDLFDVMPGVRSMFGSIEVQIRMLSLVIEVITGTTTQQTEMERRLRQLGRKHAEMGVSSLHMKVARSSLLKAASLACPELDEIELDYFGSCYLRIITAMNERGPVLVELEPDEPTRLH